MAGKGGDTFADRLNYLIENVYPAHHGPWSNAEVSKGITEQGGHLSKAAIGKLRKGENVNPTLATIRALARFFGVPTSFFTDEDTHSTEVDIALAVLERDATVTDTMLRMGQLSEQSINIIADLSQTLINFEESHSKASSSKSEQQNNGDYQKRG
ncbi:helix-turn-helix domain-containing protein [Amycolatopsis aidingensis]|uniref:helix-turn-helix domain-containing protein n=1 Tax=Amycolatopsis aidingensis TaxID=2842453 RepID=UPI001C0BF2D2|nr:helix-turn-helix transcriptional regulator [Amycolatopsis aidingensis]